MTLSPAEAAKILQRPGTLVFPENLNITNEWQTRGGKVVRRPSGHTVFYLASGRRLLMTDPNGHPLHECAWTQDAGGHTTLAMARLYLDWGQWVGIKPNGLINTTSLDLTRRAGWDRVTRQDLRQMAAQSLRVPLKEVEFFYRDDDLVIDQAGQATIRQRKDAFYVLADGTFEKAQFMSCMSAMNWERIDYLPVVELFLSLLPGTGSATFELIRELYDDQNVGVPRLLRYRGIPPYPSEGAFGLFSQFFVPSLPSGENPFPVFMDASRSHEVLWAPHPTPPQRFIDDGQGLSFTVANGLVQKITRKEDSTGLSFQLPDNKGFIFNGRTFRIQNGEGILIDFDEQIKISLPESLSVDRGSASRPYQQPQRNWRQFFPQGAPNVSAQSAFSTVLLYPEDETEIGELASQPFIADYWDDVMESTPQLADRVAKASQVLIENFDATITTLLMLQSGAKHTVLFSDAAWAQKHAQSVWNKLARSGQLNRCAGIQFLPKEQNEARADQQAYDLVYCWLPFAAYGQRQELADRLQRLNRALRPGGLACLAGPQELQQHLRPLHLNVLASQPAANLPTFRMHRTILPKACLNEQLTAWVLHKGS